MGGHIKTRITRKENKLSIEKEIAHCYHQRSIEDNKVWVLMESNRVKKFQDELLQEIFKGSFASVNIGKSIKKDSFNFPNSPIINYLIKKETKYICKVIYETTYGVCSFNFSKNGTADWCVVNSTNPEILQKCYDRIAVLKLIEQELYKEFVNE